MAKKDIAKDAAAADQLMDLVMGTMRLFHSTDGRPFAAVARDGHTEYIEINSEKFHLLLVRTFFGTKGKTIAKAAIETVARHLSAHALLDGPTKAVHNRVAANPEGGIVVDIADDTWQSIVVSADGWVVTSGAAVFARDRAQVGMPSPVEGGDVDELREYMPLSDTDWYLLVAWIVKAFTASGPYPLLEITGRQGSAKSVRTRLLVALIDPHIGDMQSLPREERDLMIAALHSHVLAFDNLSHLPAGMSDCFCRLATGGGFRIRKLYSDSEETIIDACKPVIINGINRLCTQQDLISRAVQITVPPITPEERLSEDEVMARFRAAQPRILGAFLTLLSRALAILPQVQLDAMPRMADFARLGVAVERAAGWPPDSFLGAYDRSIQMALEASVEEDPVGSAIAQLLSSQQSWAGTASDLLASLAIYVPSSVLQSKSWPKAPNWLSFRLDRLAPGLEAIGITLSRSEYAEGGARKTITLSQEDAEPSATEFACVVADAIAYGENPCGTRPEHDTHAMYANSDIFLAEEKKEEK